MRWSCLVFTTLLACRSDEVATTPADTIMHATSRDGRTEVRICAAPTGFLSCKGSEKFHVELNGLVRSATTDLYSFGASKAVFPFEGGGMVVTVTRERDGATATVTLPTPFTITAASWSGDTIDVGWAPGSDGDMRWTLTVQCGNTQFFREGDGADVGDTRIDADGLMTEHPDCPASVTLNRRRDGVVTGFTRGTAIYGEQERGISVRR